jgi:DNA-binding transcriptional LysR family regulator
MFRAAERIFEAIGKAAPGHIPDLRIGVSAAVSRSIATDFLLPLLTLEECLPTVQSGDFPLLVQALRRHDLDLVLAESTPPHNGRSGLQVADVHRPRLVAVVKPGTEVAANWASSAIIQYGVASHYRWEVESYLDANDLHPRIAAETDDALLMLEAAARADCIAFVARGLARDAIAAGRVEVLATLEPGSASVHAIYHDDESSEMVRRAVTLLVDHAVALEA